MTAQLRADLRKAVRFVLISPLAVVLILFDIVKIPVLIIFSPLWLLLDLIEVTKGEKSSFVEMIANMSTIGLQVIRELWSEKR